VRVLARSLQAGVLLLWLVVVPLLTSSTRDRALQQLLVSFADGNSQVANVTLCLSCSVKCVAVVVQNALRKVVNGVGGFDHAQWRAFSNERTTNDASGFIDGDLIEQARRCQYAAC